MDMRRSRAGAMVEPLLLLQRTWFGPQHPWQMAYSSMEFDNFY